MEERNEPKIGENVREKEGRKEGRKEGKKEVDRKLKEGMQVGKMKVRKLTGKMDIRNPTRGE